MYRIPRFNDKDIHISSEVREAWVKEQVSQQKRFSVFSICGELSSTEFIELIMNNPTYDGLCDSYEVIFGPEIESDGIKAKLKELIRNPKLKAYSYSYRPPDHAIKVEDRLFCEERHEPGTKYSFATIVERADKEVQRKFMTMFNTLKANSTLVTLENIDSIPTMRKSI